jgi:hypothetical protein
MNSNQEKNRAAFEAVKYQLNNRYPLGRFVAFDDGQIVADAGSFDELSETLAAISKDRPDVFVVQAGTNYPDEVFILLSCHGREQNSAFPAPPATVDCAGSSAAIIRAF